MPLQRSGRPFDLSCMANDNSSSSSSGGSAGGNVE